MTIALDLHAELSWPAPTGQRVLPPPSVQSDPPAWPQQYDGYLMPWTVIHSGANPTTTANTTISHNGGRNGGQPAPQRNDSPPIADQVIDDLRRRKEFGMTKYGTPLQAHNGRDPLQDLYEELLDAAQYVKQELVERRDARDEQFRRDVAIALGLIDWDLAPMTDEALLYKVRSLRLESTRVERRVAELEDLLAGWRDANGRVHDELHAAKVRIAELEAAVDDRETIAKALRSDLQRAEEEACAARAEVVVARADRSVVISDLHTLKTRSHRFNLAGLLVPGDVPEDRQAELYMASLRGAVESLRSIERSLGLEEPLSLGDLMETVAAHLQQCTSMLRVTPHPGEEELLGHVMESVCVRAEVLAHALGIKEPFALRLDNLIGKAAGTIAGGGLSEFERERVAKQLLAASQRIAELEARVESLQNGAAA